MKFTPVIHPEAENELYEIAFYLDEQRNGLGDIFISEYFETLTYLEEFAEAAPVIHEVFRHIPIGRFQVLIIYTIDQDFVRIRKIIHGARAENSRYQR
jgi:hypothetical protein